jgi:hypothetical protein
MKSDGYICHFINLFQQLRLKHGPKYCCWVFAGLFALLSTYADQQPFNLQIHLKTSNLQPVPPVAAATWCNTIKNNLPSDAIPANPGQPIIQCSPEEGGLLVNLNLQYTPPSPQGTDVRFDNEASIDIKVYGVYKNGSSYTSDTHSQYAKWTATQLLTGSQLEICMRVSGECQDKKYKTIPAPDSENHNRRLTCKGSWFSYKCTWDNE